MLLLILFVLFYIFIEQKNIKVTADDLVQSYIANPKKADKKYLDKNIEITGQVKSFYEFEGEKNILALQIADEKIVVYCLLMNKQVEDKVKTLTSSNEITVIGKCLGINPPSAEKFPESIYIEAEKIK